MTNKEIFASILTEVFMLDSASVTSASTETVPAWDSVGKMSLVVALEDAFSIELEAEDIISLNSYVEGLDILKKNGIDL